jgi:voltage-gated potassium channel
MKTLTSQLLALVDQRSSHKNVRLLRMYLLIFAAMVTVYSLIFRLLMELEGQHHSLTTGFYWTLTVMSTLGFGDITFHSDLGRFFSMIVLMSGMVFLLVVLPFTFIEFFYAPWIRVQEANRAPRQLKGEVQGHVIITVYDPVTAALIRKLKQYRHRYVVIVKEVEDALKLHDEGVDVLVGASDFPEVYEAARVSTAAMLVTTGTDQMNTNVTFTAREIAKTLPIMATASDEDSVDILQFSGATQVIQLGRLMGQWLARRTIGGDAMAHRIGEFDQLQIAEAMAAGTPMVGKTIAESGLRENVGISVAGVWERGLFRAATSRTVISKQTVLVLAGTAEQLTMYDEMFCIYHRASAPVVIVGGGRVGRATGREFKERGVDFRIVERMPERVREEFEGHYVMGNAADIKTLEEAGIREAPAVIITSHDDEMNVYLTIYCRKLRPDIEIISRSTEERIVDTLHRAGSDFVMSYASMGANIVYNKLRGGDRLMVAEGLDLFRVETPDRLIGRPIKASGIREETGCNIVAIGKAGTLEPNPLPDYVLEKGHTMVLMGTPENEARFLERWG